MLDLVKLVERVTKSRGIMMMYWRVMMYWRPAIAAVALICAQLSPAEARDWPDKPARILVGFGAGGGTDVVARILADKLSEVLGQRFVVENRPGAGGTIAGSIAAKAPNDGYTANGAASRGTT